MDHGELRDDPLFEVLVGRREIERGRAGKRTLHWFELGVDGPDRPGKITGEESVLKRFSVRSHLGLHREPAGGVLPTAPKK